MLHSAVYAPLCTSECRSRQVQGIDSECSAQRLDVPPPLEAGSADVRRMDQHQGRPGPHRFVVDLLTVPGIPTGFPGMCASNDGSGTIESAFGIGIAGATGAVGGW